MGLATIDPHSQKDHTEIHKIPKGERHLKTKKIYKEMYGNADKSGHLSGFVRILIHFFVNFFCF